MSTEFLSRATGDLGFVRWAGGCSARFEFGTMTNWENVMGWVRSGDRFDPLGGCVLAGDPVTAEDFEQLVVSGWASFGESPVTVELGSGEMTQFSVES